MKIGKELKNCVRTYKDRVLNKTIAIVAVADDSGKLIACLELAKSDHTKIRFDKLVQAKLYANAPATKDGAVNGAIVSWANKHHIKPLTTDIEVTATVV